MLPRRLPSHPSPPIATLIQLIVLVTLTTFRQIKTSFDLESRQQASPRLHLSLAILRIACLMWVAKDQSVKNGYTALKM